MVSQDEINSNFLDVIRWLKSEYGYTQAYIVEKAELAPNAISKIKNGKANAGDETITKLCNAFNLNHDYFYGRSSYKTKLEESEAKLDENIRQAQASIQSQPYIDPCSLMNATISAQIETIANLKQTIADMKEQHKRELAEKDAHLADLTKLAEERLHRIAELKRTIDANNLSEFPFPMGSAEDGIKPKRKRL